MQDTSDTALDLHLFIPSSIFNLLVRCLFPLASIFTFGQVGEAQLNFSWVIGLATDYSENGESIVCDNNGNIYVTGTFFDSLDFDPGPSKEILHTNNKGLFLAKYTQGGRLLWALNDSSYGASKGLFVDLDSQGNVYLAGTFDVDISFRNDSTHSIHYSNGYDDIFIAKFDAYGNYLWCGTLGSPNDDIINDLTVSSERNIYVVGGFNDTVDFDLGPTTYDLASSGQMDGFLCKYSQDGMFDWGYSIGANKNDVSQSVTVDKYGNLLVTGIIQNTITLQTDTGTVQLGQYGERKSYLSKFDSSGKVIWAYDLELVTPRLYGSYYSDHFYFVGHFKGIVDFALDTSIAKLTAHANETDAFLTKYNLDGELVWAYQIGNFSYPERLNGISEDINGNIYLTGYFVGTVDFDPGPDTVNLSVPSSSIYGDIFLASYDSSCNYLWAGRMGSSTAGDEGMDIDVDLHGNVFTTGLYQLKGNFNPGGSGGSGPSGAAYNIFITKHYTCLDNLYTTSRTICDGDTIQFGSKEINLEGIYIDTFLNANGCDSIVELTLNLDTFLYACRDVQVCQYDTIYLNGSPITSQGTYIDTVSSSLNCDTLLELHVSYLHADTTYLSDTVCQGNSYQFNGITCNNPGTYSVTLSNSSNCDSTVILELHHLNNDTSLINETLCIGESYFFDGRFLDSSGQYQKVIVNHNGCDSVILLNLTFNPIQSIHIDTSICQGESFIAGGIPFMVEGTYNIILTNAFGCDSNVVLNLDVININPTINSPNDTALTAIQPNAIYQWLNCDLGRIPIAGATNRTFIPPSAGNYAVIIKLDSCLDTSACFYFKPIGNDIHDFSINFKLQPNPSSGNIFVNLNFEAPIESSFLFFNEQGILVRKFQLNPNNAFHTFLLDLPPGIYVYHLTTGGTKNISGKLAVTK